MSHNSVLYVPFAVFMCVNHLTCVYYLRGQRIKEIAFCEKTWCMVYDWICSNEGQALQTSLSESPSRWKISFVEWTNFKYIYMYKWLFTTYVSKRLTTWPEKGQNSNNFQSRDPTRYPKTNFEADQERDWESEGGGSVQEIKTVVTLVTQVVCLIYRFYTRR